VRKGQLRVKWRESTAVFGGRVETYIPLKTEGGMHALKSRLSFDIAGSEKLDWHSAHLAAQPELEIHPL
jgi:hypothetical protein